METPPAFQSQSDLQHLKLLEIFHYIVAGLALLGIGFLALHYTFMNAMFNNPQMWEQARRQAEQQHQPPFDPTQFFHFFIWIYVVMGVFFLMLSTGNIASAICLRRRKNRMFSLIVAGINCIQIPFGTTLGVFTIIVLVRPSVMALYENQSDGSPLG